MVYQVIEELKEPIRGPVHNSLEPGPKVHIQHSWSGLPCIEMYSSATVDRFRSPWSQCHHGWTAVSRAHYVKGTAVQQKPRQFHSCRRAAGRPRGETIYLPVGVGRTCGRSTVGYASVGYADRGVCSPSIHPSQRRPTTTFDYRPPSDYEMCFQWRWACYLAQPTFPWHRTGKRLPWHR